MNFWQGYSWVIRNNDSVAGTGRGKSAVRWEDAAIRFCRWPAYKPATSGRSTSRPVQLESNGGSSGEIAGATLACGAPHYGSRSDTSRARKPAEGFTAHA